MHTASEVVLVVDDDAAVRETLSRGIARARPSARVLTAPDGAAAIEALRSKRVDLIIADQQVPGMTGIELLERAREIAPRVPRLMMAGDPEIGLVLRGVNEAHVARFLAKPFPLEAATRAVDELLDARRAERKREAAIARAVSLAAARVTAARGARDGPQAPA